MIWTEIDYLFYGTVLPNITYGLSVYGASDAVACAAGGIVWLKFWRRSRDPKKGSGDEAFEILFLAASPLVAAPQPTLTRLVQRLPRQISLA